MKKKDRARYDRDPGLDVLEKAVIGIDDLIKPGVDEAVRQIGREPSCATCREPGCCYQFVLLTLAEALPLARLLIQRGLDTERFRRRLRETGAEMEALGHLGWWKQARPCLFLHDGRCSVYSLRPIMCRAHHSWSPSKLCQPPKVADVQTLEMVGVQRAMLRMNRELCVELGLDEAVHYISSLPRMLSVALEVLYRPTKSALDYLRREEFLEAGKVASWFAKVALGAPEKLSA